MPSQAFSDRRANVVARVHRPALALIWQHTVTLLTGVVAIKGQNADIMTAKAREHVVSL